MDVNALKIEPCSILSTFTSVDVDALGVNGPLELILATHVYEPDLEMGV